jgi:uncharacterized membrane protein YozB (DUF420 family)
MTRNQDSVLTLGRGHHSPRSDDTLFQTVLLLPLIEVFILCFPFATPAFVGFFVTVFDFTIVLAFAFTITSILASALITKGEVEMPPTKLATEPSKIIVFTKPVKLLSACGVFTPAE